MDTAAESSRVTGEDGAVSVPRETVPPSRRWWRDALRRRQLALADLLAGAFAGAIVIGSPEGTLWAVALSPIWVVLAKALGNYDRDHRAIRHQTVDEMAPVLAWAALGTIALSLALSATPVGYLSGREAVTLCLLAAGAGLALRAAARLLWRQLVPPERAVVLGRGRDAEAIRRKLVLFGDMNVGLVRRVDPPADDLDPESRARALHELSEGADRIIIAAPEMSAESVAELRAHCRASQVKLSGVSPLRGRALTSPRLTQIADLPVFEFETWDVSRSTMAAKRAFDVVFATVALVLSAPLLLAIGVLVKLDSRGPVLFRQARAGLEGRPFRMLKFRTMCQDAEQQLPEVVRLEELDEPMFKVDDDPRVTRVGRVLRRFSLDELPQLLNVLQGTMSIVGPRPEQVEIVELYRPDHRFRLTVKPGMTGPMQVYGRGRLSFEERLAVEFEYIENLSLARDLKLLATTVPSVLRGTGAS